MAKTFRKLISEWNAVHITKDKVDMKTVEARGELNRNLARQMANRQYDNPQEAIQTIRRVLETYGVDLPKVVLNPNNGGESITYITQYGVKMETDYFLYFQYVAARNGTYDCFAVVTDEKGLNTLLER